MRARRTSLHTRARCLIEKGSRRGLEARGQRLRGLTFGRLAHGQCYPSVEESNTRLLSVHDRAVRALATFACLLLLPGELDTPIRKLLRTHLVEKHGVGSGTTCWPRKRLENQALA